MLRMAVSGHQLDGGAESPVSGPFPPVPKPSASCCCRRRLCPSGVASPSAAAAAPLRRRLGADAAAAAARPCSIQVNSTCVRVHVWASSLPGVSHH